MHVQACVNIEEYDTAIKAYIICRVFKHAFTSKTLNITFSEKCRQFSAYWKGQTRVKFTTARKASFGIAYSHKV